MRHLLHVAILTLLFTVPVLAAPELTCDQARVNFGPVLTGSELKHTYVLFNAGDADLEITEVKPACGCTVAELKVKLLKPGQSVELPVTLALGHHPGGFSKSIRIDSNDPKQPHFKLWLEGVATSPVTVTPHRVFFGQMQLGKSVSRTIDIVIDGESNTNITSAEIIRRRSDKSGHVFGKELTVQLEPVTTGALYRAHVRFDPTNMSHDHQGKFSSIVRLHTDHPELPHVDVPVSGVISGELSYAPQSIVLTPGHDEPLVRYILVTRSSKGGSREAFKIKKVTAPLPEIDVQIKPIGRHGYRIRLSNLLASMDLKGKSLVIETDTASMPKLHVPFQIPPPEVSPEVAQAGSEEVRDGGQ